MTTPKTMTPRQMKKMLLDMRAQLLQEIAENVKAESGTEKAEIGDLYDLATSERDRELSLLLGDRDRAKLKEIDDALKRIDEGTYGICEECGEKIAAGRLKAMPFTRLCVNCQANLERQQKMKRETEEEGFYRDLPFGEDEES